MEPLRLRIHVSEPFDFERDNGSPDLFGTTTDHLRPDADEWEVALEGRFSFNDHDYDMVLLGPRYVGEHLGQVHNSSLGVPVRIAHRARASWHYAMAGMLSIAPLRPDTGDDAPAGDTQER